MELNSLGSRFRNFPNPEENGYTLVGWPKNLVTVDEAKQLAGDLMLDRGFEPERLGLFPGRSTGASIVREPNSG